METTITRPIRKKYSHSIANAKKNQKHKEAEARQKQRNTRSNEKQLDKLDKGGYIAKKERSKLIKK